MTPAAETTTEEAIEPLSVADRCDRCGSQALVRVRLRPAGSGLLFCGHHWHDHEDALMLVAADVYDSREQA